MGYHWDKLMSEVGPVALGLSLIALWTLWVLSRRGGAAEREGGEGDGGAQEALSAGRAQVKSRLTSAGLALIEPLRLLDKSSQPPEELELDFVTVFGDGLWLLRVIALEGTASGDLSEELWPLRGEGAEAELMNPTLVDQRLVRVVKRVAQSKKLSGVKVSYGLVYVGGELKVRSDERVSVLSLAQLSKRVKRSAKRSASSPDAELDGARELWRHLKQRDRAQLELSDEA